VGAGRGKADGVDAIAIVIVAAMLAAPGFGLTLAFARPSALPLLSRIALALPLGFCVIALVSLGLAIGGVHHLALFVPLVLAVTAALWWVGLRREGIGPYLEAWRAELVRLRGTYLLLLVLLVGFAIVRATYGPEGQVAPTALRYWADGVQIADAHGVPEGALHWNTLVDPTVSKVALNAFHASISGVIGREPLRALSALLAVVAIGLFLIAFVLARKLGLRRTAGIVAVLWFGNLVLGGTDLAGDLNHYHAENWGRLVVLGAVLLGIRAMRSEAHAWFLRDRATADVPTRGDQADERSIAARCALVAGVMFGVAAGTHLVAFAVGSLFLLCYGVGLVVAAPRFRWRPVRVGALLIPCAVVIGVVVLFLPRGDIGFQGAAGREAYASALEQLELPDPFDPTLYLATGEFHQAAHFESLGFYDPPADAYRLFVASMLGLPNAPARGIALLAVPVLLACAAALVVFGSRILRALGIAAVLFTFGVIATALAFLWRYDLYALAHFGRRRLFDYASIPLVLLLAGVLELGLDVARGRRTGGITLPRAAIPMTAAGVTLALAAAVFPSAIERDRVGDRVSLAGLTWVRNHVPCEGRILADRRTLATFESITGRAAVLEGMGPHVRPQLLATAVEEMLLAREFLLYPRWHRRYLQERGISTVLVTQAANRLGGWYKVLPDLRPPRIAAGRSVEAGPGVGSRFERLLEVRFLELVHRTPDLAVFHVRTFDPASAPGPDVRSLPGFDCTPPPRPLPPPDPGVTTMGA
jgi:hypothetical protein